MGPISNIGPKTSQAARDRPELNPRKQTSRHDIAGRRPHSAARSPQHVRRIAHDAPTSGTSGGRQIVQQLRPRLAAAAGLHARSSSNWLAQHRATLAQSSSNFGWPLRVQRAAAYAQTRGEGRQNARRRPIALIPLLGNRGGSGSRLPARQLKNKIRPGNVQYNSIITQYEPFIGCFSGCYLVGDLRLAPTGITRIPALHGITDSACKNQLVVVSVQYGPFNPYIPIRSTIIGQSRVVIDPIAMHTSWRSNSDIASVTSIGYPRISASGESSTTIHRLLHASGSHPIPPPYDPNTTKTSDLSTRQMVTTWKVRTRVVR
ncbi:hypothetical protein F511_02733 [Dorcoceras hygrometricum]|uniref:Uncharacterized protein n=1 Tax=Dorcoceras hygrometricum TaxID=472368 RepID=A0A2Z7AFN4_9LAMI|nr:hypothetical protein F511_02733 [Dorcoceras hygrometricum]